MGKDDFNGFDELVKKYQEESDETKRKELEKKILQILNLVSFDK